MNTTTPREAWHVVNSLQQCMSSGEHGLNVVPLLVIKIVNEELWKEIYCDPIKEKIGFKSFAEFVTAELPQGLGASVQVLKDLCQRDPAARDAIDRATQTPHGGDRRSEQADFKFDNSKLEAPTGTTRDYALRRLRKDRPDLHSEVVEGRKSAHSAMVEAGFRRKATPAETLRKAFAKIEPEQQFDHLRDLTKMATQETRESLRHWLESENP